ncbi:hypothetical protein BDFB_011932 [Asbolus verrucosus]|uniref:Uncharacterized protein n=1 Tax=Asbolus verrucosus TaxID=1661398 RepID=A0A482VVX9_ASBVE|nr:hypothetical protein BDFB_011932 [Asbolus verrucosus]
MHIVTEISVHKVDTKAKDSVHDLVNEIMLKSNIEPGKVMDIPTTIKIMSEENQKPLNKIEEPQIVNAPPEDKPKNREKLKGMRHEPPQPEEPVVENQVPSKPLKILVPNEKI